MVEKIFTQKDFHKPIIEDIYVQLTTEVLSLCQNIASKICEKGLYQFEIDPDIIANVMIDITDFNEENFNEEKVVEKIENLIGKINEEATKKQRNHISNADISACILPTCRKYQEVFRSKHGFEPSLEVVFNSLILTVESDENKIADSYIYKFR